MEPLCDFCKAARAVVYCESDSAQLCPQCDGYIHSANSLAHRHSRSLLCEKCGSQPAFVQCSNEKLALCQGCDWSDPRSSGASHSGQGVNCYSGCPSTAESSSIWASNLNQPPSAGEFDSGWCSYDGLSCILEGNEREVSYGPVGPNRLTEIESWLGLPMSHTTAPHLSCMQFARDQLAQSASPDLIPPQVGSIIN